MTTKNKRNLSFAFKVFVALLFSFGLQISLSGQLDCDNTLVCNFLPQASPSCSIDEFELTLLLDDDYNWNSGSSAGDPNDIDISLRFIGNGYQTIYINGTDLKVDLGQLQIEQCTLVITNGGITLDDAASVMILHNVVLRSEKKLVQKAGSDLCVFNSELEIGDEQSNGSFTGSDHTTATWQNDGGYRYVFGTCANVTSDLEVFNGGEDNWVYTCVEIGDKGDTNVSENMADDGSDNGHFYNNGVSNFFHSEFLVPAGKIKFDGSLNFLCDVDFAAMGDGNLEVKNGTTMSGCETNFWIKGEGEIDIESEVIWNLDIDSYHGPYKDDSEELPGGLEESTDEEMSSLYSDCPCFTIGYYCIAPSYGTPETTAGTCNGYFPSNDVTISIENIENGFLIGISEGPSYTGPTLADADPIILGSHSFDDLLNDTEYIIRIYNSDVCYTDVTVLTPEIVCCTAPVCDISSPEELCWGEDLFIDLTTDIGDSFVWSGPNGFSSSEQDLSFTSVTNLQDGVFEVTVTESSTGCTSTCSVDLTINNLPFVTLSNNGPIMCKHYDIQLSTEPDGALYNWSGPNGFNSSEQNPVVDAPGIYTVEVIDASSGCSNTKSTTVGIIEDGHINGFVHEDMDNDDIGDDPVVGFSVELYYENDLPVLDDNNLPVSSITDENGYYEFINLCPDDYKIKLIRDAGYYAVLEGDFSDDGDAQDGLFDQDDIIPLSLNELEIDADNNYIVERLGSISGTVQKQFTVFDDDGNMNTVFVPQSGMNMILKNENDDEIASVTTDVIGNYAFELLPKGIYSVACPPVSFGWEDISDQDESTGPGDPDGGNDAIDNEIPVDLDRAESDEDNNFIDAQLGTIGDFIFFDEDQDGVQDLFEAGIENVEIALMTAGVDGQHYTPDDEVFDTQISNASGGYLFEMVPTDDYYIIVDPLSLPENHVFTTKNEGTNDKKDSDVNVFGYSEIFTAEPGQVENLSIDAGAILDDPCYEWEMSGPNTQITVGVVANPDIIGSQSDIVFTTFLVVNVGSQSFNNVVLTPEVELLSGAPYDASMTVTFAGDPNGNDILDPGEVWFYSAVNSFEYSQGNILIISAGVLGEAECGNEIGAAADLLFTSGMNMDVEIEEESARPGDVINVKLTSRLLIDEDLVSNPGIKTVHNHGHDIDVPLAASRWEARDIRIAATGLNDGHVFDPFDDTIEGLINFCDQNEDGGRNNNNVLDEQESVDTVREPCSVENENDRLCEYPDWSFCYEIKIPENYSHAHFEVKASDYFNVWKADEILAGSSEFGEFIDVTDLMKTNGEDKAIIRIGYDQGHVDLNFEIQPNPVDEELNLFIHSFINNHQYEIEILDIYGKQMLNYSTINSVKRSLKFDVSALNSGQYLLILSDGNKSKIKRFIKI